MLDPGQSVGFLVADIARMLRRNFIRRAQGLGLSQAQWQALAHLSIREGVNQATLAESLEVQPITLARLIDRLEQGGLVERRPDPEDRRAFRLYLTAVAQPLLAKMWTLAAETRTEAMAGLPDEAVTALIETLRHMKRNLLDAESRFGRVAVAKEAAEDARGSD